jgi:CRISPR-associated endonuclease Csn1
MTTTLGLDLGPNSIGWALVDSEPARIIDTGVRVFAEGVDQFDTKKEKPRNEARRIARGMRRQIRRRSERKRAVRRALVAAGLLPADHDQFRRLLSEDPYELRARSLDEKLDVHEIGRIFLHLSMRRGFLSNRKKDRKDSEVKGMLAEINDLAAQMKQAGCTLGQLLHRKALTLDHTAREKDDHVRRRHTLRQMLVDEFHQIWKSQAIHYPNLLTQRLRYGAGGPCAQPQLPQRLPKALTALEAHGIEGLLFFQRPMYWPRSVVGTCELERKEKRCLRADRRAQRFRLLQEVNNLRYIDPQDNLEKSLDPDKRRLLIQELSTRREMTFEQLKRALDMQTVQFNLEKGKRSRLQGMVTDCDLAHKKILGPDWHKRPEEQRNQIVSLLLQSTDDEQTRSVLIEQHGFSAEQADAALAVDLPPGYVNLSLKAINNIMPFLEQGLRLMGNDATDSAIHAAGYLRADELHRRIFDRLPDLTHARDLRIADIPNPVVKRTLVELRKVVNAIVGKYGRPDAIHVEMARQVRQGCKARSEYNSRIREIEAERKAAEEDIRDRGAKVNRDSILQVLLWKQQNRNCVYCGNKISQIQLFTGEVNVDHILPYSRSLDDSQMNKVLCHIGCNHDKRDQTPYQWLAKTNPDAFERMCQTALSLVRNGTFPYRKYRRLIQKELDLKDFIARQLTATGYIASATAEYLRCLFDAPHHVLGLKGELTAELRHQWALDDVLSSLPDSPAWQQQSGLRPGEKNRADHRHHAIDAVVVALTDRSRLQGLSRIRKAGGTRATGEVLDEPWPSFRDDVISRIRDIRVSHRPERKVSGALHEDTFYGPTPEAGVYVARKSVEALSPAEVPRIRDQAIRRIVEQRLVSYGLEVGRGKKIDGPTWRKALADLRMPSGVPVRKVRVLKNEQTILPVRESKPDQALVKPGSTHHLAIFEWLQRGKTKRDKAPDHPGHAGDRPPAAPDRYQAPGQPSDCSPARSFRLFPQPGRNGAGRLAGK